MLTTSPAFTHGPRLLSLIDSIVKKHTGAASFEGWVTAEVMIPSNTYRPSLYTKPRTGKAKDVQHALECRILADAWDDEMSRRGLTHRLAYRGTN